MVRRNWRDFVPVSDVQSSVSEAGFHNAAEQPTGNLETAVRMLPTNERLSELLGERRALEQTIQSITGQSPNSESDRFPVLTFAERQAQERAWTERRAAMHNRQDQRFRTVRGGTDRFQNELAPTALMQRVTGEPPARSNLLDHLRGDDIFSQSLDNITNRGGQTPTTQQPRGAVRRIRRVGEEAERQGRNLSDQIGDMDHQMAERGVSQVDRDEMRKMMKGDKIDAVNRKMSKANSALNAPKRAAKSLDRLWGQQKQKVISPLDKMGSYADARDRRLSSEFGGSGDLFERMQRNRERALERRREKARQDRRDAARRNSASRNAKARKKR